MNCTELCIKSNFSFLKSGSHPEEYAARAVNLGLESFAITDENSVSGIVRAHSELKRIMRNSNANSVLKTRLIPGTEIITVEGLKVTALAKNRKGWANICRLLTEGKSKEKKGLCKLSINDVIKYGNNIALLLPYFRKI